MGHYWIQHKADWKTIPSENLRKVVSGFEHLLQFALENDEARAYVLNVLVQGMHGKIPLTLGDLKAAEIQLNDAKQNLARDEKIVREMKSEYLDGTKVTERGAAQRIIATLPEGVWLTVAKLPKDYRRYAIICVTLGAKKVLSEGKLFTSSKAALSNGLKGKFYINDLKDWNDLAKYCRGGKAYVSPTRSAAEKWENKVNELKMAISEHDEFIKSLNETYV